MNKPKKNNHQDKNKKGLIALSVLLILAGGMITDPFAGLICFALAGIISLVAVLTATKWVRYVALFLLVVAAILIISQFPQARNHYQNYRDKSVPGITK
jgi:membrane protein implicated in regulation of membrane protease activity